jgi:hypothetical protein
LSDAETLRRAEPLRETMRDTAERFERLLTGDSDLREAKMAAMCDRLAALVCSILLLGEADACARAGLGYRKLLVADNYRRRRLDRVEPLDLGDEGVQWLDEVVDWGLVPAGAAP